MILSSELDWRSKGQTVALAIALSVAFISAFHLNTGEPLVLILHSHNRDACDIHVHKARYQMHNSSSLFPNSAPVPQRNEPPASTEELPNAYHDHSIDLVDTSPLAKSKHVIAGLVTNDTGDLMYLCNGLLSLSNLPDAWGNHSGPMADVLVFQDNLNQKNKHFLQSCTSRNVLFPHLEYSFDTFFPKGFDPVNEEPNWKKRSKWGYQQMIRFWITHVWHHPAIRPYTTMMRLDSDACWNSHTLGGNELEIYRHLPSLPDNDAVVYHANRIKNDLVSVTEGFGIFVHEYVKKHNITIKNPDLWRRMPAVNGTGAPAFYNNFEVTRIEFFRRPEVMKFHDAVTEHEPFGVFRERWGDAIVRYATMALFAEEDQVVGMRTPPGYRHGKKDGMCRTTPEELIHRIFYKFNH